MNTFFNGGTDPHMVHEIMNRTIEFVSDRKEVLSILTQSKDYGTAVAINSIHLGPGFIVTAVEDIILDEEGDITILLKSFDMTGHFLDKTNLKLAEIRGVIKLESSFPNPFLKNLDNTNVA